MHNDPFGARFMLVKYHSIHNVTRNNATHSDLLDARIRPIDSGERILVAYCDYA